MAKHPSIHKWKKAGSFANSRCSVSYTEVGGESIRCLHFERRSGPTMQWTHNERVFHLMNRKAGDRFMCSEETHIAAMVAAFQAGAKSWKL